MLYRGDDADDEDGQAGGGNKRGSWKCGELEAAFCQHDWTGLLFQAARFGSPSLFLACGTWPPQAPRQTEGLSVPCRRTPSPSACSPRVRPPRMISDACGTLTLTRNRSLLDLGQPPGECRRLVSLAPRLRLLALRHRRLDAAQQPDL